MQILKDLYGVHGLIKIEVGERRGHRVEMGFAYIDELKKIEKPCC
jgi:hypothetical protein